LGSAQFLGYGILAVLLMIGAGPAAAVTALQKKCSDPGPSDERIAACTKLIDSGADEGDWRASYFVNRGNAWSGKKECDRALADIDAGIEQ
jgi:hypothetical protein